jgi:hypothetical protein
MVRAHRVARAITVLLCAAASLPGRADDAATELVIKEGPSQMWPQERTLTADPAKGIEHAVILVDETIQNDQFGSGARVEFHRRAKILSNEGRDLANVEIPFKKGSTVLRNWWGKVLLPDGTVLQMKQGELREKTLSETTGGTRLVKYGVLPGVIPGAVIDYGYVMDRDFYYPMFQVPLQRRYFTKSLRFRWLPIRSKSSAIRRKHPDTLAVTVTRGDGSVLLAGTDLAPFVSEPYMPPADEVVGQVRFYYPDTLYKTADFWNEAAKDIEWSTTASIERIKDLDRLLAAAGLPVASGSRLPPREAIPKLHEWMRQNLKNTDLLTPAEEEERASAKARQEEPVPASIEELLKRGEAKGWFLRVVFVGCARRLGADAHELLVTDRTDQFWDRSLLTLKQFSDRLVAFKLPEEPDEKYTVVATGRRFAFNEMPWWQTAQDGFLATADGMRKVFVPPPEARNTVAETAVKIVFEEDPSSAAASWTRKETGQHGYDTHHRLRIADEANRKEMLDANSGAASRVELTSARAEGVDDLGLPLKVACESSLSETGFDESAETFRYSWSDQAWVEGLPDLTAPSRIHPLVFPFPHADLLTLDVKAPEGWEPAAAPEAVNLMTAWGRYRLEVKRSGEGFHVERNIAFLPIRIEPASYSQFLQFLNDIRRADRKPLEFRRGSEAP